MSEIAPLTYEECHAREAAGLKHRVRASTAQAESCGEHARANMIAPHLRYNRLYNLMPLEELFTTAYGQAGSAAFWDIECSEPIKLKRFITLLALTNERDRRDSAELGLRDAIQAAAHSAEECFVGNTAALKAAATVWDVKDGGTLRIDVRRMATWMLSKPLRQRLVPTSLVAYLERGVPTTSILGTVSPQPAITASKRGPKDDLGRKTMARILADLQGGKISEADLRGGQKQASLAARYGVKSRTTVMKAARAALAQFARNSIATISGN